MPPTALRRLAAVARPDPAADPQLVRAFLLTRDEAAFAELVRRHGPMVLAVCRRVLGHREDAEDAFQAAFLVLARKAGSVRGANLAGWLYAVAVRTARGVRHMRDRRKRHELASGGRQPPEAMSHQGADAPRSPEHTELAAIVDEVLAGLPEHYRLPVVLCELQGRSRKDAAVELGIPEGTLSSRLAAARRKLADRLTRRGMTTPAAGLVAVLVPTAGPVAADLTRAAVRAAVADGVASAVAAEAAAGVVKGLLVAKLKAGAVAVAVAAGFAGGLVVATAPGGAVAADGPEVAPAPRPVGAALVAQLGDPLFARREAAAKDLRRLGLAAVPALLAGVRDANPEVARRSRDLHAQVRGDALVTLTSRFDPAGTAEPDHPLWQRFRQVAGDDAAARKLFARMIADPDRLWRLDRAEADPAGAGAVYVAEAVRLADWSYRDHIKKIDRLTVPDAAAVLFLGTYPGAADAVGEKQEWHERIAVGVSDFADGKAGDLQPALARLLAAWLPARTRPDQAEAGLKVVRDLKLRECLPVLRRLAADDATAPPTRALSALLVGTLGGRGEVPLLRRVAEGKVAAEPHDRVQVIVKGQEVFDRLWADERFGGPKPKPEDWKKAFDEADIRKGTRSVADCAWAAAVHAAGGKPVELGFLWPVTVAGRKVEDITHPGFHGFETPAARAAAYAKAAAWLDEHAANPAALVKRLGADEFAAREAAAKALRALGAKAVPALAAAARDPNPEVARRAADVLGLIRADALAAFAKSFDPAGTADYDHPVWTRYKQVVGDDRSARELFAAIIRDQDRLRLLADAEGDPAGAGGLYQREGKRLYEAYKARLDPPNTGEVDFSALPVPEAAAVVYLGTYPASTGKPDPWWAPHRILTHPTATRRTGTPAGWRTDPAARRLYAAWLAHRDREHVLCDGLERAAAYGLEEVLPFARAVAADRDRPAKVRCAALSVLARLGSKADLPAVEALFADETEVDTFRLSRAVEGPKIDGTASVQARDYAVGMALLLYGQNPADFGFDLARGRWQAVDGKPDLNRYEPFHFGFVNGDDARPAAHRKARAWLAVNAAVAPPRQGKVWDHFKAVVGDDKTAGELFDRIVSDPKTRELLEKAAAGDKDARKLALDRSAELSKLAPGRDPVPLPDILGWVLSQTFPAAAVRNGDPYFVHFFPGHLRDDAPARAYVREMTDGPRRPRPASSLPPGRTGSRSGRAGTSVWGWPSSSASRTPSRPPGRS